MILDLVTAMRAATAAVLIATATLAPPAPVAAGEYYAPRLLYPGTYGNFCGPTPEVSAGGGCSERGWKGNVPIDAVDAACLAHDMRYCACESALRERRGPRATPSSLSVLTALRTTGLSVPVLESLGVDEEYLGCAHEADVGLISDGMRVRSAAQRGGCTGSPYDAPRWFCDLSGPILGRVELVDFGLFLSNLDWNG